MSQVKQHSLHTFPVDCFSTPGNLFSLPHQPVSHSLSAAPCESWHFTLCVPKAQSNPREGNPTLPEQPLCPQKGQIQSLLRLQIKYQVFLL